MSGVLVSWTLVPDALPLLIWVSVTLLMAISFADDVSGLPVWLRLLLHGAIAAALSFAMLFDTHGWIIATVATVAITWMLNLYNFMDGSDGLAGGMTLIGFGTYGAIAWSAGNESFAMINFCIAAAARAFLLFNFHPARIFMGDMGSIPLGFLAAVLGLAGWINGDWPLWLPSAGIFAFYCRCLRYAYKTRSPRCKSLAGASRALLSAHGAKRAGSPYYGPVRLYSYVGGGRQRNVGNETEYLCSAWGLHRLVRNLCSDDACLRSPLEAPPRRLVIRPAP